MQKFHQPQFNWPLAGVNRSRLVQAPERVTCKVLPLGRFFTCCSLVATGQEKCDFRATKWPFSRSLLFLRSARDSFFKQNQDGPRESSIVVVVVDVLRASVSVSCRPRSPLVFVIMGPKLWIGGGAVAQTEPKVDTGRQRQGPDERRASELFSFSPFLAPAAGYVVVVSPV